MGGSIVDIFIYKYILNQDSSYKEVYILEGGWTPYFTLERNVYKSYMAEFTSNIVQKLCNLLKGRGSLKDHIVSQGGGEVKTGQKRIA